MWTVYAGRERCQDSDGVDESFWNGQGVEMGAKQPLTFDVYAMGRRTCSERPWRGDTQPRLGGPIEEGRAAWKGARTRCTVLFGIKHPVSLEGAWFQDTFCAQAHHPPCDLTTLKYLTRRMHSRHPSSSPEGN